jgi:hypothetical protein
MNQDMKRYLIYFNLALFCIVVWYFIAELMLTLVWSKLWS